MGATQAKENKKNEVRFVTMGWSWDGMVSSGAHISPFCLFVWWMLT